MLRLEALHHRSGRYTLKWRVGGAAVERDNFGGPMATPRATDAYLHNVGPQTEAPGLARGLPPASFGPSPTTCWRDRRSWVSPQQEHLGLIPWALEKVEGLCQRRAGAAVDAFTGGSTSFSSAGQRRRRFVSDVAGLLRRGLDHFRSTPAGPGSPDAPFPTVRQFRYRELVTRSRWRHAATCLRPLAICLCPGGAWRCCSAFSVGPRRRREPYLGAQPPPALLQDAPTLAKIAGTRRRRSTSGR